MIIKNVDNLATNNIRRDALKIAEAGYEAVSISKIINNTLRFTDEHLVIDGTKYELAKYKKIYVIALGKGTGLICEALESIIGSDRITAGVAIDLKHRKLNKIKVFAGSHPLPSQKNISATNKLIQIARSARAKDLVITVVCGGGSALACMPVQKNGIHQIRDVYHELLNSGADINELNTVRKHIGKIHGGFLAKYIYPATSIGLIISDIPGGKTDIVASGPISPDETTVKDAEAVLNKYSIQNYKLIETPKDRRFFKKIHKHLIASGSTAVTAMQQEADRLGYSSKIISTDLQGEAKDIGKQLAKAILPGQAMLACGETTVIVRKPGKGGRNQDLALSALPFLPDNSAIISAASDGKDNIDVAGGIADSETYKNFGLSIDPTRAVEDNHSFSALSRINGIYHIRKVTANVSDFIVVLRKG